MPQPGRANRSPLGAVGTLRSFVSVLREISFDEVREQAEQPPRLLVLAPTADEATRLATALVGAGGPRTVTSRALDDADVRPNAYDAVIVFDPAGTGAVSRLRQRLGTDDDATQVSPLGGDRVDDERAVASLRTAITNRLPDLAPSFGRHCPAFRAPATKAVIDETARANAQFALVSNIPAVIPVFGALASASADFLVLTKNQLMLLFKIAAIHGRDLHDQWGIMREMVPVVGAGLLWRTVAREAASFIPLAAGTIPKVAIAYAGTLSVGRAAEFYYQMGEKPSGDQMRGFYQQAAEAVKKLPLPLPGKDGDQAERAAPPALAATDGDQAARLAGSASGTGIPSGERTVAANERADASG